MIERLLEEYYGLTAVSVEKSNAGAGSDTYFVQCESGKYVVKFPSASEINNPEAEPKLCEYLLERGISVCRFLRNRQGEYLTCCNGLSCHVQQFILGRMYGWNQAPAWLMNQSARLLGRIHSVLKGYSGLPTGIGAAFFQYMTPQNALLSYENTIKAARDRGDMETEADLAYRIELMKRFPDYSFDLDNMTCTATHGDYFISQLLCGEGTINAVIDWTTACVHPAVWEVVRSYVYAAPECAAGEISIPGLTDYFAEYLRFAELTEYDVQMSVRLFFYQIAVCDYYNQYYSSAAANREIYLQQAVFSTRLLKWFEEYTQEATDALLLMYHDGHR